MREGFSESGTIKAMSSQESIDAARRLVMRYGWNAAAYQIVHPSFEHWFSKEPEAVVGFVRRGGVAVVAGAPVCAETALPAVVRAWEAWCAAEGLRPCYFGAGERLRAFGSSEGPYAQVLLGAQPVWRGDAWEAAMRARGSLRAQLARARHKGVAVEEWPATQAQAHPELRRCLSEWLNRRGLPPLRFLVEPSTLGHLRDRRVFVARREGSVVGFVVLSPVPCRSGWLTEQFVRGRGAPNGTVELLLDAAVRTVCAEGAEYVTMGLVPLSSRLRPESPHPFWLRVLLGWVRAHGRRFYDFEGLERFKAKFQPTEWEGIYALSKEPRLSWRSLRAMAAAFTEGSVEGALLRGLGRALRRELCGIGALLQL